MNKDEAKAFGFHVTVEGIPALAVVRYYNPGQNGSGRGEPWSFASISAPEPEEVEYEIFDRKGYRAHWLENKLNNRHVEDDVTQQVLDALNTVDI